MTAAAQTPDTQETLIAQEFKPTSIPKPELLPGPEPELQEEVGTRNLLTDVILPYFAIGMISFVGGLSLVFLIIGGVRFATAYGNEEAITKAKNQVIYSIVGFIVALLSYTIVSIVINLQIEDDKQAPPEEKTVEGFEEFAEKSFTEVVEPGETQ